MANNKRNHLLDILKGICIIMVIFTHYSWSAEERKIFLFPFWIDMAVPVFMVISGYVFSLSYEKHKQFSVIELYRISDLWRRQLRYTVPFLIAYIIEVFAYHIVGAHQSVKEIIWDFFRGGQGPGSYYYPVMCQFVLVFPLVFLLIKRLHGKGVILCFLLNFVYEFLKEVYGVNDGTYRLIIFRYLFLISFGAYYYEEERINKQKIYIPMFIFGVLWQILIRYTAYKSIIINYAWASTSMLSACYIIPLFVIVAKHGKNWRFKILEELGRASYHIFLVQMVYYIFAASMVKSISNSVEENIIINITVCIFTGYVFYRLETALEKKILKITVPVIAKYDLFLFG